MREILLFILSLIILLAFFYASYFIFSDKVNTNDQNLLLLIGSAYGSIVTITGTITTYWFGSTKSSGDKDKAISNLSKS